MDHDLVLHGFVLSAMPIGENDKRIVLLTKERGKLSAFSRGARRANSPLLAGSVPMTYGRFYVYEGRSSYTVHRIEVENFFDDIKNDLSRVAYGSFFMEMAEYYGLEGADEEERMALLYQSLRALASENFPDRLVRSVYELKTMAINGDYPNVFGCIVCGRHDNLKGFSMEKRGLMCGEHADTTSTPIDPSVLYAMQFIISTPPTKLFTFKLSPKVEEALYKLVTAYRRRYEEHKFKSETFIDML